MGFGDWLGDNVGKLVGAGISGIGMMTQKNRNKKAQQQQMALNEQGQALGMQTWRDTNYSEQMKEMKSAGLNPSLMYGRGGEGGKIASPSGGSAPAQPMDISGQMANNAMIKQNIAESKSREDLNRITATKATGETWTEEENAYRKGNVINKGSEEVANIVSKTEGQNIMNEINKATTEEQKTLIRRKVIEQKVNIQLQESKIELTDEQIRKIYHEIMQKWVAAGTGALNSINIGSIIKNATRKGKTPRITTWE